MKTGLKTPILFIIFNRPKTTEMVIETIRKARPAKLFIAADGPRENRLDEKELCEETRKIVSNINWTCEVKTLFQEHNLGCKIGVSTAINWFFENVEEGIILEDDCLPNESFFIFCEEMLERYRDDTRVMHISGSNFQFGKHFGDGDYYFSNIPHIWGWATWKRAWSKYDLKMSNLDKFIKNNYIKDVFINNRKLNKTYINNLLKVRDGKLDTWDYQWMYSVWSQNGLSIIPNKNLVKNIGFGNNATHTKNKNLLLEKNNTVPMIFNKHPTKIEGHRDADQCYHKKFEVSLVRRAYAKLKNIIKYIN